MQITLNYSCSWSCKLFRHLCKRKKRSAVKLFQKKKIFLKMCIQKIWAIFTTVWLIRSIWTVISAITNSWSVDTTSVWYTGELWVSTAYNRHTTEEREKGIKRIRKITCGEILRTNKFFNNRRFHKKDLLLYWPFYIMQVSIIISIFFSFWLLKKKETK